MTELQDLRKPRAKQLTHNQANIIMDWIKENMAASDVAKKLYTWINGFNADKAAEYWGVTRAQIDKLVRVDLERNVYNERITGKAVDTEAVFQRMTIQDAKVEALTTKVEALTKLLSDLARENVGHTVREDLETAQKRIDVLESRVTALEGQTTQKNLENVSLHVGTLFDKVEKRLDYVEDFLTSDAQKAEKWLKRHAAPALAVVKK